MRLLDFPNPRYTADHGIVGLGGDLHWQNLVAAYRKGIFPWPIEDLPTPWFCPQERAVLFFDELHVSRSLLRAARKGDFRFTVDEKFSEVIRECSRAPRPQQDGTWITGEMMEAYCELHRRGFAHSVEVWQEHALVGGLYGVDPGGAFSGESMFFLQPNASKLALLFLIDRLRAKGLEWIDIQMMTPHMEALGARLIPRIEFLDLLADTLRQRRALW